MAPLDFPIADLGITYLKSRGEVHLLVGRVLQGLIATTMENQVRQSC